LLTTSSSRAAGTTSSYADWRSPTIQISIITVNVKITIKFIITTKDPTTATTRTTAIGADTTNEQAAGKESPDDTPTSSAAETSVPQEAGVALLLNHQQYRYHRRQHRQ
jgi:hypothetical protein